MASPALRRVHAPRRLQAWWRGAAFDNALAAGADPTSDPRLAAHAARLARPDCVEALAARLENAVAEAERHGPAAPVRASEVLAARDELLALAALLRTAPHPSPRALALCRRLVIDRAGPLLHPVVAGTLHGAVREARLALGGAPRAYPRST